MLGTLPVALTTARCSRDSRLARAVLFWMMSGPPMASSIGRFSLVSLGFWLICAAGWVCSSAPAYGMRALAAAFAALSTMQAL